MQVFFCNRKVDDKAMGVCRNLAEESLIIVDALCLDPALFSVRKLKIALI
jgi:hypothetical protein